MAQTTPVRAVRVTGLNELVRACRVANKEMAKDIRTAIEQAGEPIRQQSQELVRTEISGMARSRIPWWTIRLGVERNTMGYVVPAQRGGRRGKGRRRNLAGLIAEREQRALANNIDRIEDEFKDAMAQVARAWARV